MESLLKKSFIALKQNNKLTWVYKELKRQTDKLQNDVRIEELQLLTHLNE